MSSGQSGGTYGERSPLLREVESSPSKDNQPSSKDRPAVSGAMCVFYCVFNILVATAIVFANKAVFSWYSFKFVFALTLIHTVFTWAGMALMARMNFFTPKKIPQAKLTPLAFGFVGYIVLCNVSLNLNSVGFYQIMKIAIAPTVVLLEFIMFRKLPGPWMLLSVLIVCLGVGIATVTDSIVISNTAGLVVGVAATFVTAMYQIWAGSKQKELQANSSQLLHGYTPQATALLSLLVPIFEPLGIPDGGEDTLIGYPYTAAAVAAIVASALLGIMVSLSTFLIIGSTSSLTYNIVGHIKTVLILAGGCIIFGDEMPLMRFAGIVIAMLGIGWYTQMTVAASMAAQPAVVKVITPMPKSASTDNTSGGGNGGNNNN